MPKSNFLLVDLNEPKTKKLAETITSETSRKILNYLAERKDDSEAKIAEALQLPISTVHYHLQKLQEAGLVTVEEFHYSPKGREVNRYKLANKYIIIAPQKVEGLREKLKGILPVVGMVLGIGLVIKFIQSATAPIMSKTGDLAVEAKPSAAFETVSSFSEGGSISTVSQPDIVFWFFMGSVVSLVLYLLIQIFKEWKNKQ